MILEPVRLLADWLGASGQFTGNTSGINTLLAAIPRDAGDAAPAAVTLFDETRDNAVARGDLPDTLPALMVTSRKIDQLDGEVATYTRDGVIELIVRYAQLNAATKDALRDASYVLRAALRSVRAFNAETRTRNQIDVYSCLHLEVVSLWTPHESGIVTGALVGRWQFRDNAP